MQTKYAEILGLIDEWVEDGINDFRTMSEAVHAALSSASPPELVNVVEQIGVIPEAYDHDSTHEKLYAKMSDCVVAHIFDALGFETKVLTERADSADVVGRSIFHTYDFVADAKVFRLSRTAKNQKDFKVGSMSLWKKDANYAVIVCPFYQYPSTSSQIFSQVLSTGVALSSFEHLLFCLNCGVKETRGVSLRSLFSYPAALAERVVVAERKLARHVMSALDAAVAEICGKSIIDVHEFRSSLKRSILSPRAANEIAYWEEELVKIKSLSREEAQEALIESRKIRSKIESIGHFILS